MSPRPLDTSPETWAVYTAALDRMSGSERVRAAMELSEAVRELRLAGIRTRHPELTEKQVVARWVLEEHGIVLPETV